MCYKDLYDDRYKRYKDLYDDRYKRYKDLHMKTVIRRFDMNSITVIYNRTGLYNMTSLDELKQTE